MRPLLALALIATGCSFGVRGVDSGVATEGDDLAGVEPGSCDDLATSGDVADMAMPASPDLATPLPPPPDMASPTLMVSHVPQHYLTDGTCDLVVNTSIDTGTRKVDGADVPAGCVFANDSEPGSLAVAVLAARSVVFAGNVTISGTQPLVVV